MPACIGKAIDPNAWHLVGSLCTQALACVLQTITRPPTLRGMCRSMSMMSKACAPPASTILSIASCPSIALVTCMHHVCLIISLPACGHLAPSLHCNTCPQGLVVPLAMGFRKPL